MIQNVGSQALDQLSAKKPPKKNYKTNRKDIDGGALDIHKAIRKLRIMCVAENSGVSYAAAATPHVASEDSSLDRPATYRNEYYLTNFERANFHPENVTPERPCTAYFNSDIFADSNAVFGALKTQGFPTKAIRCLQRKPSGDMLITFANARVKDAFVEKNIT